MRLGVLMVKLKLLFWNHRQCQTADADKIINFIDYFNIKRIEQNKFWLYQTIEDSLKSNFYHHKKVKEELQLQLKAIELNETTPFAAAQYLLTLL